MWSDLFELISDQITEFITAFTSQSTIYNGFMSFIKSGSPEGYEGVFTYADMIYSLLMAVVIFFVIFGLVKLFKFILNSITGGFING